MIDFSGRGSALWAAILAIALSILPTATHAQGVESYPSKPVTLVVPFAPGGFPDITARIVGQKLSERFGQSFVVDNRPSAGGLVAAETVAKAAADGYTLLVGTFSLWGIAPALFKTIPFDPETSYSPISIVSTADNFFFVNNDIPGANLKEVIAYLKAHPGKYSYGTPAIGSIHHLMTETLKKDAGIDIVHVPYKGGAQVSQGLASGEVSIAFLSIGNANSLIETGKGHLVAVASNKRSSLSPEVPTFTEQGYPALQFPGAVGFLAPANTPKEVAAMLAPAIAEIGKLPDVIERLKMAGIEPVGSSTAELAEMISSDRRRLKAAADVAGLKPE